MQLDPYTFTIGYFITTQKVIAWRYCANNLSLETWLCPNVVKSCPYSVNPHSSLIHLPRLVNDRYTYTEEGMLIGSHFFFSINNQLFPFSSSSKAQVPSVVYIISRAGTCISNRKKADTNNSFLWIHLLPNSQFPIPNSHRFSVFLQIPTRWDHWNHASC